MKPGTFIGILLFFALSIPLVSSAGEVNITIGVPAPLTFAGPPEVVVVPSGDAYVYMVPGTLGLYFYNGYWYRSDRGRWYRSHVYNGTWGYIERHRVPRYVVDVPPDYYRHLPRDYNRIHYRDLNRNWREWNRDRHWNRYDWYKREHREHQRRRQNYHRPQRDDRRTPHGLHNDGRYDGSGRDRGKLDD